MLPIESITTTETQFVVVEYYAQKLAAPESTVGFLVRQNWWPIVKLRDDEPTRLGDLSVIISIKRRGRGQYRDSCHTVMSLAVLQKKLILVIGATGAQGLAVIDGLLKPAANGTPSPYSIRAVTRNVESVRAKELATRGVELFEGSTDEPDKILAAMDGVYGAFVNTDSFTIGEMKEVYTGMRIFELAKQVGTVKHFVWSGLDYSFKKGGYDPIYRCVHHDAKGRVSDWMRAQPSVVSEDDMSWSILSTMRMLGPLNKREDGTYVFASPIGVGHVPMVTLEDVGFFARYIFDHRESTSAQELEIASDWVDWPHLVSTFTKVTGKPAVYVPLTMEEWFGLWVQDDINMPLANEKKAPDGSTTWKENFMAWWSQYRDDLIKRDWKWLREVNPKGHTLETWMRATGYTGDTDLSLLKNSQDGKLHRLNAELIHWKPLLGAHLKRVVFLEDESVAARGGGGDGNRHSPQVSTWLLMIRAEMQHVKAFSVVRIPVEIALVILSTERGEQPFCVFTPTNNRPCLFSRLALRPLTVDVAFILSQEGSNGTEREANTLSVFVKLRLGLLNDRSLVRAYAVHPLRVRCQPHHKYGVVR
ncbi:hypothetical protein NUW54_g2379 [Trametes sanguinea]|uniref:Uncharacterized protein n=1 Tax=Trametes sanguinea TaxID=158606 RepID=A0ACC1Q6L7_9APHY|nr:hypothetical protein NUW54_g2379 [Trametes sanguinea]